MMAKLTDKQKQFCEEYLIDLNATQAAIRAGYSTKTATVTACENLMKPNIQEYISLLKGKREERTNITQDMVVNELAKTAFGSIKDLYDEKGLMKEPYQLDDDVASTISSFKSKREMLEKDSDGNPVFGVIDEYKRLDKLKALEMLGKHLGIFEKDNKQSTQDKLQIEII